MREEELLDNFSISLDLLHDLFAKLIKTLESI